MESEHLMTKSIPLRGQYGTGKSVIVDDEDYEYLHDKVLYADKREFVYIKIGRNKYLLHRFILDIHGKIEPMIDHRNHNRLDNSRNNLRECTNSQNQANTKSWEGRDSKGVYFCRGKWVARIMVNGIRKYIGRFLDKDEAIREYQKESISSFGEFAYQKEE